MDLRCVCGAIVGARRPGGTVEGTKNVGDAWGAPHGSSALEITWMVMMDGVGHATPPSEPYVRISRIRLSSRRFAPIWRPEVLPVPNQESRARVRQSKVSPLASRLASMSWPNRVHLHCRRYGSFRCFPPPPYGGRSYFKFSPAQR